jgi:hypothetical protein
VLRVGKKGMGRSPEKILGFWGEVVISELIMFGASSSGGGTKMSATLVAKC